MKNGDWKYFILIVLLLIGDIICAAKAPNWEPLFVGGLAGYAFSMTLSYIRLRDMINKFISTTRAALDARK